MSASNSNLSFTLETLGIAIALLLLTFLVRFSVENTASSPVVTPSPTHISVDMAAVTRFPTATPLPTPTPIPTAMPTPRPTPSPTSPHLSPPFVAPGGNEGGDGWVAYVESGYLTVVHPDGHREVVGAGLSAAAPVRWSPDGRRLLYATGLPQAPVYHVWERDTNVRHHLRDLPDSSGVHLVGTSDAPWSPDSTRVLLLANSENRNEDVPPFRVWVWNLSTDQLWPILKSGAATQEPEEMWSAPPPVWVTTDTLRYVNPLSGTEQQVHIGPPPVWITATLSPSLPLPPGERPVVSLPIPSPDGRYLAYALEGERTLLLAPGSPEEQRIITGILPAPSSWSPDGRLLAGSACMDGRSGSECSLAVTDVLSNWLTLLTPSDPTWPGGVAWSPGGGYLAYAVGEQLWIWDRAWGRSQVLTTAPPAHSFTNLQWASDGCRLYAARRDEEAVVESLWGIGPAWDAYWQIAPTDGERSPAPCPPSQLAGRRIVAYYGTPLGPGLGILGRDNATATLTLLREQMATYAALDPAREHIPAFHMVTTIADAYPGDKAVYNHHVPTDTVRSWADVIRAAGGWAVLDIQPAHADLEVELARVESLLREPDVHLAVDPEFKMSLAEHIPGEQLGRITGAEINRVQAWLDRLARSAGTRKMLIIHQFDERMIVHKDDLLHYAFVELVWDADGFGSPGSKTGDYRQYSQEAGFEYGGFKLFYDYDTPLMNPADVLALDPPVAYVVYQ